MTERNNPLLDKIKLPGRKFRLPSRGLFYTGGEIDENTVDGEVEVFSMTAIDEINLRTPDLLFSGEAIERVFTRCIPQIHKPLDLIGKDVDFLLSCLRVVSYGNEIEINHQCPECLEEANIKIKREVDKFLDEVEVKAEEQGVPLEEAIESKAVSDKINLIRARHDVTEKVKVNINSIITNKVTELDEEMMQSFEHDLSNGQHIRFCPMKMRDTIEVYRTADRIQNDEINTSEEAEEYITFMIGASIESVDGIDDRELISEWIKNLSVKLKDEITAHIASLPEWGVDFTHTIKCKKCKSTDKTSSAINPIAFFT